MSYQNQDTGEVNSIQDGAPVRPDPVGTARNSALPTVRLHLKLLFHIVGELFGRELEPNSYDGEQAKGSQLDCDASHAQVSSHTQLVLGILICSLGGRYEDGTDRLEEQSNNVKGEKYWGYPSRC